MEDIGLKQKILSRTKFKPWLAKHVRIRRIVINPIDHPYRAPIGRKKKKIPWFVRSSNINSFFLGIMLSLIYLILYIIFVIRILHHDQMGKGNWPKQQHWGQEEIKHHCITVKCLDFKIHFVMIVANISLKIVILKALLISSLAMANPYIW